MFCLCGKKGVIKSKQKGENPQEEVTSLSKKKIRGEPLTSNALKSNQQTPPNKGKKSLTINSLKQRHFSPKASGSRNTWMNLVNETQLQMETEYHPPAQSRVALLVSRFQRNPHVQVDKC